MPLLPQRISLTDQVVEVVRGGLGSARWTDRLPSEAGLCRELQVSRVTLRRALQQLIRENWIEAGGRGRHHRIVGKPPSSLVQTTRTVRILTPFNSAKLGSSDHSLLEALSGVLSAAGYRLETECHPQVFERCRPSKLARLDALPDTAAWALFFSTGEIQQWFVASGRPTVVAGRVHDDLPLSSIYPDSGAAARHAAGLLCSRGHRELVYLIANLTSLSDRLASETFVAEARGHGARVRIVNYEAGTGSAGRAMMNLLASRPRPTGFVTGASELAITVLCHLQASGIRIPAEASVISLWDDFSLSFTHPVVTRYRTDGKTLGHQIGRTLLDQLRHGSGKVRTVPVIPEYVAGESVGPGPPPKAKSNR